MKMKFLLLFLPAILSAQNLHELIKQAQKENDIVLAKRYTQDAKEKSVTAQKSSYFPTVDLGGVYKRDDAVSPFQAGDVYSAYAKVAIDLYDGGRRSSEINSKKASLNASSFETIAFKKSLALDITKNFFDIKTLQASLNAKEEAQKALQAQLKRIKEFYNVKMATLDDVERVQSDFDTNLYSMQTIRFQILSLKSQLELKVGKKITSLDNSSFKKEISHNYTLLENIKAIDAQKNAIRYSANSVDSYYYPNIHLEDKYSLYSYDRLSPLAKHASPLDKQNVLLLTANIRIFDFGRLAKTKEVLKLNAAALSSQIEYQTKEQKMQYNLAIARIKTTKLKIKSSKSALNAATTAFKTIEKKYNAGIVDYIVYLDALTKKTSTKALYESSLNDLEVAYAIYYYYSGKNILEELQK